MPRRAPGPAATPPAASVFAPTLDRHGTRLALVFGNHAPGGRCPWHRAGACHHCDIGAGEGARFDLTANRARLAWFAAHHAQVLPTVDHLVLYNSGSLLSPVQLPAELLDELLAFARALPRVRAVSVDTREGHLTATRLARALAALGPRAVLRPIVGLESADDRVRLDVLDKRSPRRALARALAVLGEVGRAAAARSETPRLGLDVNILVGGPGTDAESAVDDAVATARFALAAGEAHGLAVDLDLHPYYPSVRGRARFPDHPRCDVATAARAARAVAAIAAGARPGPSYVFVGWNDEGHDADPARAAAVARAAPAFDAFHRTGDPAALDGL